MVPSNSGGVARRPLGFRRLAAGAPLATSLVIEGSGEMRREMKRLARRGLECAALAVLLAGVTSGLPQSASAAAPVDGCPDSDYVDATAAGANRAIVWNIFVASTAQRCLEIQVGQKVLWDGDLSEHPLVSDEGATPNPIDDHDAAGNVTFTQPGTFGYKCVIHSQMIGAVRVVAAATAVPAATPLLTALLVLFLLGVGLARRHRPAEPATA
jgi:plastocyanin